MMRSLGIPVASFYEPPEDIVQREIAETVRRQFDTKLLSPDRRGIRDSLAILKQNGVVAIFADEARGGRTMAPLFGRPPHGEGNLAIAARLARHTGAQLVVIHCERLPGVRFRLHFGEPFILPAGEHNLFDDVSLLNAAIEPIILKHLNRWYYLDDSIAPLDG
ncbi:lipid A biosynthesis lauroyl acyltransferase [Bosea sp. BIWAKO-01]|nr:lipid A biosynthesis lauroyl acyltransferase [Bosea sp. BIWAKO-01]